MFHPLDFARLRHVQSPLAAEVSEEVPLGVAAEAVEAVEYVMVAPRSSSLRSQRSPSAPVFSPSHFQKALVTTAGFNSTATTCFTSITAAQRSHAYG